MKNGGGWQWAWWRSVLCGFCVVWGLCAGWSETSHANVAVYGVSKVFEGPETVRPTRLIVERGFVSINCTELQQSGTRSRCWFRARYRIHNPTKTTELARGFFLGMGSDARRVEVDGRNVRLSLDPQEVNAFHALVDERKEWEPLSLQLILHRTMYGFGIEVAPGAVTTLAVSGEIRPRYLTEVLVLEPVRARHLLLNSFEHGTSYGLNYMLAPLRTWAQVGVIGVRITYPKGWEIEGGPTGHSSAVKGDRASVSYRVDATQVDDLGVEVIDPGSSVSHGGPLVGIGGAYGSQGGFRARLGWELGVGESMLVGLYGESDFADLRLVVPTLEIASPWAFIIFPSASLGLGLPVRVRPETTVGVRGQLALHLAALGFVVALDYFPADDEPWQVGLLGQFGF